jgi:hypothetical protein
MSSFVFFQIRGYYCQQEIVRQGYYFVVQITSVKKDTISFKTVDIFSAQSPIYIPKQIDNTGNTIPFGNNYYRLCNRSFERGTVKRFNKKHIGKVVVLHVVDITDQGLVLFEPVKSERELRLNELYPIGRNCQ